MTPADRAEDDNRSIIEVKMKATQVRELNKGNYNMQLTYRVAQKSKPPPKIANEIRFLRKVKV